jgi:hypothetical protein
MANKKQRRQPVPILQARVAIKNNKREFMKLFVFLLAAISLGLSNPPFAAAAEKISDSL